jgi:hypothetical protein
MARTERTTSAKSPVALISLIIIGDYSRSLFQAEHP